MCNKMHAEVKTIWGHKLRVLLALIVDVQLTQRAYQESRIDVACPVAKHLHVEYRANRTNARKDDSLRVKLTSYNANTLVRAELNLRTRAF